MNTCKDGVFFPEGRIEVIFPMRGVWKQPAMFVCRLKGVIVNTDKVRCFSYVGAL